MTAIKPIRNFIVVKPFMGDAETEFGIIIPDSLRERKSMATVLATGNGTKDKPMYVKQGDIVWHIKGAGQDIEENGQELFLMPTDDILGYLPTENQKK